MQEEEEGLDAGAKEIGRETWWLLEVKPRASLMRLVVIPSLQRRVHATRALVEEGKEGQEVYE